MATVTDMERGRKYMTLETKEKSKEKGKTEQEKVEV